MKQEPLLRSTVALVRRAAGTGAMFIDWNIDYHVGEGTVSSTEKCLWTKDGRRISCKLMPHGGYIISQGKEPDPLYPKLERKF